MERGPNDKQQKQEPILQIAAADGAARGKREETAADGEGSCEFRAIFRLSEDSTNDRATLFANNLTLIRQLSPDVNLRITSEGIRIEAQEAATAACGQVMFAKDDFFAEYECKKPLVIGVHIDTVEKAFKAHLHDKTGWLELEVLARKETPMLSVKSSKGKTQIKLMELDHSPNEFNLPEFPSQWKCDASALQKLIKEFKTFEVHEVQWCMGIHPETKKDMMVLTGKADRTDTSQIWEHGDKFLVEKRHSIPIVQLYRQKILFSCLERIPVSTVLLRMSQDTPMWLQYDLRTQCREFGNDDKSAPTEGLKSYFNLYIAPKILENGVEETEDYVIGVWKTHCKDETARETQSKKRKPKDAASASKAKSNKKRKVDVVAPNEDEAKPDE